MNHIKAVLFDFDGVLTTDPSGSFTTIGFLARETGISERELWDAFAPHNHDLLLGRTSHAAIWPSVCSALGRELDQALLRDAFDSTPMNARMLELARAIARDFALGIVTDNRSDRMQHLVRRHALDRTFAAIVVSADCGTCKSEPGIFQRALAALEVDAHEAVFIDNSEANLVAPRALGLHTVHFDGATNDVDGLARVLRKQFGVGVPAPVSGTATPNAPDRGNFSAANA